MSEGPRREGGREGLREAASLCVGTSVDERSNPTPRVCSTDSWNDDGGEITAVTSDHLCGEAEWSATLTPVYARLLVLSLSDLGL